jgi:hypothetical protein
MQSASDYNEELPFHQLIIRITDMSAADFQTMATVLEHCDQTRLTRNKIAHLLEEAKDLWRPSVRTSTQAMAQREKAETG